MRYLEELDLSGNELYNLNKVLDELESLSTLRILSLYGCPCANEADYRARTLARMPFLSILDCKVVGETERRVASDAFGKMHASGAVLVKARVESTVRATKNHNQEIILASSARSHAPPITHSRLQELRSDGVLDLGNASGVAGLGRVPLPLPPPNIVFGQGFNNSTSTRAHIRVLAEKARKKWDNLERERVKAEFSLPQGNTWSSKIDHNMFSTSSVETTDKSTRCDPTEPILATSALINITQPAACEDIATKKTREGMLRRGVHPALLSDTKERDEILSSSDLQSAFLTALAPAEPKLSGSAPFLPVRMPKQAPVSPIRGASKSSYNGFGIVSPRDFSHHSSGDLSQPQETLAMGYNALSNTLLDAATASGVRENAHNHRSLYRNALQSSGLRTTLRPPPHASFTAVGLKPNREPCTSVDSLAHVQVALGRSTHLADGGPLLPSIDSSGNLGEWDRYRLLTLFKSADIDGSGELSIEEIQACITAAADFGYCVALKEERVHEIAGARPPSVESSSSGRTTPLGLASSTALLGTTSGAAGRAAAQQASQRLNKLLENIFKVLDTDWSGTISWRELSQALENDWSGAETAGTVGASSKGDLKSNSEEGVKRPIPRMKFRPLQAEECLARANRHFRTARAAYQRLSDIQNAPLPAAALQRADPSAALASASAHHAFVKEECAKLQHEALVASEAAIRLQAINKALCGDYDPPLMPPPPSPTRADFFSNFHLVPASTISQSNTHSHAPRSILRLPREGLELSEDDRVTMRVLHPTQNEVEEEFENSMLGGKQMELREESAVGVLRTLGVPAWNRHRLTTKKRAPRSLFKTTTYL